MIWAGLGSTSTFDAASAIWRSWHDGETSLADAASTTTEDGTGECGGGGECEGGDYTRLVVACAVLFACAASACGVLGWESRRRRDQAEQGQAEASTSTTAQGAEAVKVATAAAVDVAAAPATSDPSSPGAGLAASSEQQPAAASSSVDHAHGERARPVSLRPTPISPTGGGGEQALEPRAVAQLSDTVLDDKGPDDEGDGGEGVRVWLAIEAVQAIDAAEAPPTSSRSAGAASSSC